MGQAMNVKRIERCESQWQQFAFMPVIRCARKAGHPVTDDWRELHFNRSAMRQWHTGNVEEAK